MRSRASEKRFRNALSCALIATCLGLPLLFTACRSAETTREPKPAAPKAKVEYSQTAPTSAAQTTAEGQVDWSAPAFPTSPLLRWQRPEQFVPPVTLKEEEWMTVTYGLTKTGHFLGGPYQGGVLVLVRRSDDGPCKGEGCDADFNWRFAKLGNRMVFLSRISNGPLEHLTPQTNPFLKLGWSVETDSEFTIPSLEYPKTIQGSSPRQMLRFLREGSDAPILDKTKMAFRHEALGNVYEAGYFYVYRPDGTSLQFEYVPDISGDDVAWTDPAPRTDALYALSRPDPEWSTGRFEVPPSLIAASDLDFHADLRQAGRAKTGDPIFTLKDPEHPFLKKRYVEYVEHYREPIDQGDGSIEVPSRKPGPRTRVDYREFIQGVPVFFWKDPFDRLTCFYNADFLPLDMAEPVIYLYPITVTRVSVRVRPAGGVQASSPPYENGWSVTAEPSGRILAGSKGRSFPYLFWEGLGSPLAVSQNGSVVARAEVNSFLQTTLSRLGLTAHETQDFVAAWLPRFSDSPYYLISFVPQPLIDDLAPLEISPAPDTIIRVLMDYRPLRKPVPATGVELPVPPRRRGFTVVEWGGIRR